ncbi:Excisionase [Pseudoalteromonas mariniglutinosa]
MLNEVLLSRYCELTGDTKKAVDSRIQRGIWCEGVHFYVVANMRERWINLGAVSEWVRKSGSMITNQTTKY